MGNNEFLGNVIGGVDFSQAVALQMIGEAAFSGQEYLTGVADLSRTQTKQIDAQAFRSTALTGVVLPQGLESLGSAANGGSTFTECSKLQYVRTAGGDKDASFELPESLTYIGGYTFRYSFAAPVRVKLPTGVQTIGSEAFNSGNIEQIVVERDSDFSGYDVKALYGAGIAVLPNEAAYQAIYKKGSEARGDITYPVTLKFQDTEIAEKKLNGKSIRYEWNEKSGFWKENTGYTLPTVDGAEAGSGFVTVWKLDGKELTDTTVLQITGSEATAVHEVALEAPTIEFTKNGAVQDSGEISVTLSSKKQQTVGIKLHHPLLERKLQPGEEVAVFYYWQDLRNWWDGPRMSAEPEIFGTWKQDQSEIPIQKPGDARTGYGSEYRVYIQLGYQKEGKTYWYKGVSQPTVLHVTVKQARRYTVAYDENGGSVLNPADYDNAIVEEGESIQLPDGPTRDGYVFAGWSGGRGLYAAGQSAAITGYTTFTAQWQTVEQWNQDHSQGKDALAVDVKVDIDTSTQPGTAASASVDAKDQKVLEEEVRQWLGEAVAGKAPAGMAAEDAQQLRNALNSGAPYVEATLTLKAALEPNPTAAQLKALLGDRAVAGKNVQLWELSAGLDVKAKDKDGNALKEAADKKIAETDPITITLVTGQRLVGKEVQILYGKDGTAQTAQSKVTDAETGTVDLTLSRFGSYVITSREKAAPAVTPAAGAGAGNNTPARTPAPTRKAERTQAAEMGTQQPKPAVQPAAIPQTGDTAHPAAVAAVGLAALIGFAVTALQKKRRK